MLWLVAQDKNYYKKDDGPLEEILQRYGVNAANLLYIPDFNEIRNLVTRPEMTCVISPALPPENFREMFVIKRLPNQNNDFLTSQEKELGAEMTDILHQRLGITVRTPKLNFSNLYGAEPLKLWCANLEKAREEGFAAKGAILVGVPGAGKDYFIDSFAGETNRIVLDFSIPLFMALDDGIQRMQKAFEILDSSQIPAIISLSEVEKMFDFEGGGKQRQFMGELMRIQAMLNQPGGYKLNGALLASANDIQPIIDHQPAYLRLGRWSERFFMNMPTQESAFGIIRGYAKKLEMDVNHEELYFMAQSEWHHYNLQEERSVYVPAEWSALIERIALFNGKGLVKEEMMLETVKNVVPQQATAANAIGSMLADRKLGFTVI